MTIETIKTVGVLGAGTMGNGIAHVFARHGYHVILRDVEKRYLDRGLETIAKNLDREVKKGKLAEDEKLLVIARIKPVTDVAALADADFVVEAVPEQLDLKLRVLKEADAALKPGAILASNTSSISITAACRADEPPGTLHRHALYESRAGDAACRSDSWPRDQRRDV